MMSLACDERSGSRPPILLDEEYFIRQIFASNELSHAALSGIAGDDLPMDSIAVLNPKSSDCL